MKMVCDDRTLREVANEFLALKKAQKVRERTLNDYKKYIDKFLTQNILRSPNAKAKGKKIGRPHATKDSIPAAFYRHYPPYRKGQLNLSELARVCSLSRTTVYKYISLLEQ